MHRDPDSQSDSPTATPDMVEPSDPHLIAGQNANLAASSNGQNTQAESANEQSEITEEELTQDTAADANQERQSQSNSQDSENKEGEDEEDEDDSLSLQLVLWICSVLIGIIIVKAFMIEIYVVVGDSMDPTLKNNQHLIVNKLANSLNTLDYGDILVFEHPDSPNKHLIKRVIAKAGDSLKIRSGQIYIKFANAADYIPLPEPYLPDFRRLPSDSMSPVEVPKDHFFVLGDNRGNSRDSRNFGTIAKTHVIGETFMIIWPRSDIEFK